MSWRTANTAVLVEGSRLLIDDFGKLDGVRVIGVDEHVWRHTRHGGKYVTVIIHLTPFHEKTGPSRLLHTVEGRTKAVFKTCLLARLHALRDGVDVVAMDRFIGFKTAAAEELPGAVREMDPLHVVGLAGDALDECRRRTQRDTFGRRGRKDDPLQGPPHPPPRRRRPHRQTAGPSQGAVRERTARRGGGERRHLPADGHRLPRSRPDSSNCVTSAER